MPWTARQNRLFRAIEHGWQPPASSGINISKRDATRMAHEGIKRARGGLALYADGGQAHRMDRPPPFELSGSTEPSYYRPVPLPSVPPPYEDTELRHLGGELERRRRAREQELLDALSDHLRGQAAFGNEISPYKLLPGFAAGGSIPAGGGDVDLGLDGGADPRLDPRSRALAAVNRRLQQQSSFESAQRASSSITAPLRTHRLSDLRHLADPFAAQYLGRAPLDTQLSLGHYPAPGLPGYAEGGEVIPRSRKTVDMTEDGRLVVRHTFYGDSPAEAEHMLRSHKRADRSFADALAGRPYKGVDIRARRLAAGGYAGGGEARRLTDLLRDLPRSERFSALRENALRPMPEEPGTYRLLSQLYSPGSPVIMAGGLPDTKLGAQAMRMAPRSRQRYMLFDSSRADPSGHATELGSLAANFTGQFRSLMRKHAPEPSWAAPQDLIDLDIARPFQRQGYGREALALMLSNVPNENDRFPLYDVKRSARKYWESLGAQMKDPSRPFRQKERLGFDDQGFRDPEASAARNNDYYITPGDFLENFADGGYADGGETSDDGSFISRHPVLTGIGVAGAALARPRTVNTLARPFMRAMARPMVSSEAVSSFALPRDAQLSRFELARDATQHPYQNLRPVHDLQGAWQGDNGMEFNRLYAQELPRTLGRVRDDPTAMSYAGQLGENLEQQAVPVNRFVPHLWNTDEGANAMMVHGVDDARLRRLAEVLGPDVVTAHRPGNRAMVFPLKDQRMSDLADETNAALGFPKIRYGRSDPLVDRVLLSREPWGDLTYREAGAEPRDGAYTMFERALLDRATKRAQRK